MKKSLLLLALIFFTIQCGGGKEAVNEDVILEEIASQETRADATQSPADTAIDSSAIIVPEPQKMPAVSQDSESVDLSQRLTVLPQFDFFFSCGDEYNIALGDSLVFVIEGDDSADVTVRLLGNDSLEKKFLFW